MVESITNYQQPLAYAQRGKTLSTLLVGGALLVFALVAVQLLSWQGSQELHTIMEVVATLLAAIVGALAFVRFYSSKNSVYLFLATGFVGTALLDGCHAVVTSSLLSYLMPSPPDSLIPWSWNASRTFLAILMTLMWGALYWESKRGETHRVHEGLVYGMVGALTLTSFFIFAYLPLPRAYYPELIFGRPQEFIAAIFFAIALCGFTSRTVLRIDSFDTWLVWSLVVGFAGQAVVMSRSFTLFDLPFDLAHSLKIVSYALVLIGLLFEVHALFQRVEDSRQSLRKLSDGLAEQAAASELLHRVSELAVETDSFDDALQQCVELICQAMGWKVGHAYLQREDGGDLQPSDIWHLAEGKDSFVKFREATMNTTIAPGIGLPGKIVASGQPALITNVQDDKNFQRSQLCSEIEVKGALGFPVKISGQVVAVLEFFSDQEKPYSEEQINLARIVGTQLGRIVERKRAEQELRNSESRTRSILEATVDAIITIDDRGIIETFNSAAEKLFGYTADEMIGKNINQLMPAPYADEHDGYLRKYLTTGVEKVIGIGREVEGLRKDGTQFPVELSVSVVQQGSRRLFTGIVRDITERKSAEIELQMAKESAEAANQAKSEFLANMSHEIRTPMTAILGYADLLLEQGDISRAPKQRIEAIKTVQRNGNHLLTIINDILDLSKVEAGKLSVEPVACSPQAIVEEVVSLMSVRAQAKGIALDVSYETSVPETICTDPTRLRQILVNLTGNAIKFTEAGGVEIIVRTVTGDHPLMEIDVVDTGIGIAPELQERLFQPFSQADTSTTRNFCGTGLGLTISRRMASLLGGDVCVVESTAGVGSRFRLNIETGPLDGTRMVAPNSVARLNQPVETDTTAKPTAPLQGRRILLAEDGPDNQRLISFVLKKAGAEVTIVENGQLAVDAALQAVDTDKSFHVVLMDMQMPVLDGYGATAKLREMDYTKPIIAVTANVMSSDREKCIRAGCDDYSTKPIDREKLISLVARYASRRGTDQQKLVASSKG